jgi:drug/metabolite transporter (DMT)-like permease
MSSKIPEIRTQPPLAIALCIGALFALVIASMAGSKLEDLLGSAAAATMVLVVWCLVGCGAAIAAVVDAYIKPEGERLSYATAIAATVFAVLALAVISGVVAGAANLGSDEPAPREIAKAQG